ncbi:ATP-dependent DNA helicase PIF1 [Folsomia candida]|uniref:ATP-dependent DNA helicase n=1 Tax=Folsomia candida TaxID=158441 RepID=A0A226DJX2_FOLCA|nr:ATP-dependent DNA helicase PIF1 [Folsomia candida]
MSDSMLERRSLQYDKSAGLGEFHLPLQFYSSFIKKQLREKAMKIQTMVLDEVSMIGMELFSFIDKRLRFLRKNNAHFGGIQAVIITENCRQVQDDEFNDVLWALRTRNIKPSHIDFLKSRFEGRVSETERQNFRLSPRIFPTRALVKAYNNYSLIQQGKPVLKIVPVVFPKNARLGLTNGSEGIFYKALYRKNYKSTSLPVVVLIYFPHYKGPCVYARNSTLPLVPIAPTTNSEFRKSADFLLANDLTLERLTTNLGFKNQHTQLLTEMDAINCGENMIHHDSAGDELIFPLEL